MYFDHTLTKQGTRPAISPRANVKYSDESTCDYCESQNIATRAGWRARTRVRTAGGLSQRAKATVMLLTGAEGPELGSR